MFSCTYESPGELAKMQVHIQWFGLSSDKFLGDVDAAGLGATY